MLLENRYQIVKTPKGDERLMYRETFCSLCAHLNFEVTDLLMKHGEQTKANKKGTWGGGF